VGGGGGYDMGQHPADFPFSCFSDCFREFRVMNTLIHAHLIYQPEARSQTCGLVAQVYRLGRKSKICSAEAAPTGQPAAKTYYVKTNLQISSKQTKE